MTQNKNKKITLKVTRTAKPQKILKVFVFASIVKPLNGATSMSKVSHLLKLNPISYTYSKDKTAVSTTYFIKGLRGAVRHAIMNICKDLDLEVCHRSH